MRAIAKKNHAFLFAFLTVIASGLSAQILFAEDGGTGATIPFSELKMIIEFNSTDKDIGIQIFFDAEPWKRVRVVAPDGQEIFEVFGRGRVRKQGMTELFFESEEPSLKDLPLSEFLNRFPEGEYKFFGMTNEGDRLIGSANFTHNIPDGPSIVSPDDDEVIDHRKVVIRWDPVVTPPGIVITGYQVIVEGDDPLRVFAIDLPADAVKVRVPREFLKPGMEYDFEILAKETSGNQTISSGSFMTKD